MKKEGIIVAILILFLLPFLQSQENQNIPEGTSLCKFSCDLDGKGTCVNEGYRTSTSYCNPETYEFWPQKSESEVCKENYECGENICVSGKCGGKGFFQKIFSWLSGIGGEDSDTEKSEEVEIISADFDKDNCVGFKDFISFTDSFGTKEGLFGSSKNGKTYEVKKDLNRDGEINLADFQVFSQSYSEGCSESQPPISAEYLEGSAFLSIEAICGKTFTDLLNPTNFNEEVIKSCCQKVNSYDKNKLEPETYNACRGFGGTI